MWYCFICEEKKKKKEMTLCRIVVLFIEMYTCTLQIQLISQSRHLLILIHEITCALDESWRNICYQRMLIVEYK